MLVQQSDTLAHSRLCYCYNKTVINAWGLIIFFKTISFLCLDFLSKTFSEPSYFLVSESPCLDLEALKAVGKNDDVVLRFQASETPAVSCTELALFQAIFSPYHVPFLPLLFEFIKCAKTGRGPRRSELFRPPCRIQSPGK